MDMVERPSEFHAQKTGNGGWVVSPASGPDYTITASFSNSRDMLVWMADELGFKASFKNGGDDEPETGGGSVLLVRRLAGEIARRKGAAIALVMGKSRTAPVVKVRHAIIEEIHKEHPEISVSDIGRAFNRDHTTILHALRKTKQEGQPR